MEPRVGFMPIFILFLLVLQNLINEELQSWLWEYDYAELNCQAH